MELIPYRYRRRFATCFHNFSIAKIEQTLPINQIDCDVIFLSMLRHTDVRMYLVAIKSTYRYIGRGSIAIIDDGTLTEGDRRLLLHHLGNVQYFSASEINTRECPRGGTWERLITILELSRHRYVVQVDADIVALNNLSEVTECIHCNRAFTLAGGSSSALKIAHEASAQVANERSDAHIQIISEQLLAQMPQAASLKYVRGCSGFAGFPRGSGDYKQISALSTWMEQRLGERWHEWGSEQFASNFLIANYPNPLVLPWPKYRSYEPLDSVSEMSSLLHFYGKNRFVNGAYKASRS